MRRFNLLLAFCLISTCVFAQVNVQVNLDTKHKLGDVETFDRQKFVNFHATTEQNNWNTDNASSDLIGDFLGDLDVHVGRNTGTISWHLKNTIDEDPLRPGFADSASIASNGASNRNSYGSKTWCHPYEYLDEQILCTQLHPFYPDGKTTNKGWAFSQTDTVDEPFGTASGEFLGRYIQEFYGTGGSTGQPKPAFLEITNEPLWDLVTTADEPHDLTKIWEFHSTVAKEVHKYNPEMKVGGYCAAFPDFDVDNFERWNERDKHFIDVAGADMDFWTIHLYDFPCIGGKAKYRKGSNVEATMDMLEQYSIMTLGHVKPLMISEYNAQTHDYNGDGWLPYRDWLKMKSTVSMMMQFMERADKINYAMPFFMLKSEWQIDYSSDPTDPTNVHTSRMMRRENEPLAYTGDFVFTEKIKVYELFKDINGTRVDTYSDNADIMVDAYVQDDKAFVLISNLDFVAHNLELDINGLGANLDSIEVRYLYLNGSDDTASPALDITQLTAADSSLTIAPEASYVLVYKFADDLSIDKLSEENKYYADKYLQTIENGVDNSFNINGVTLASYGEAVLRLGVARDHGLSLSPSVLVNGQAVAVPSNFRGGPQTQRDNFFGVLEIPIPYSLLQEDNEIDVTFSATGGHISSVSMQVFNFSHEIIRAGQEAVTGVEVQPEAFRMAPESTLQLSAEVLPSNATNSLVSWSSSNEQIASVDVRGLVQSNTAEGDVVIYATTVEGQFVDSCMVTVEQIQSATFTVDDKNKYKTTDYYVGQHIPVVLDYFAGTGHTVTNNNGGVRVLLRHMRSDWSVIQDWAFADSSTIGTNGDDITVNVSLDGITPSSELENGEFYFLFPQFTSTDGTIYNIQGLSYITIKDVSTQIKEKSPSKLHVYPNPAEHSFNVKYNGEGPFKVSLYNLQGQVVGQQSFMAQEGMVDVSELNAGLYIFRVSAAHYREQIIVQVK